MRRRCRWLRDNGILLIVHLLPQQPAVSNMYLHNSSAHSTPIHKKRLQRQISYNFFHIRTRIIVIVITISQQLNHYLSNRQRVIVICCYNKFLLHLQFRIFTQQLNYTSTCLWLVPTTIHHEKKMNAAFNNIYLCAHIETEIAPLILYTSTTLLQMEAWSRRTDSTTYKL